MIGEGRGFLVKHYIKKQPKRGKNREEEILEKISRILRGILVNYT